MKNVTLGSTNITVVQNGFGALPIQRVTETEAIEIIRNANNNGYRIQLDTYTNN